MTGYHGIVNGTARTIDSSQIAEVTNVQVAGDTITGAHFPVAARARNLKG